MQKLPRRLNLQNQQKLPRLLNLARRQKLLRLPNPQNLLRLQLLLTQESLTDQGQMTLSHNQGLFTPKREQLNPRSQKSLLSQ